MKVVFTMSHDEVEQACRRWVKDHFGVDVQETKLTINEHTQGFEEPTEINGTHRFLEIVFDDVKLPPAQTPYRG